MELSDVGKRRQFLQEKSSKEEPTKFSESEVWIQAEDMSKIPILKALGQFLGNKFSFECIVKMLALSLPWFVN